MGKINVKQAEKSDMNWINSKYREVDFIESNYENEYIVIAQVENENAGLGRLVKIDRNNIELGGIYTFSNFRGLGVAENIVRTLCEENPFKGSTIWCLPFDDLLNFYSTYGFKHRTDIKVPEKVASKLEWCNTESGYDKKVLLLCKKLTTLYK